MVLGGLSNGPPSSVGAVIGSEGDVHRNRFRLKSQAGVCSQLAQLFIIYTHIVNSLKTDRTSGDVTLLYQLLAVSSLNEKTIHTR